VNSITRETKRKREDGRDIGDGEKGLSVCEGERQVETTQTFQLAEEEMRIERERESKNKKGKRASRKGDRLASSVSLQCCM